MKNTTPDLTADRVSTPLLIMVIFVQQLIDGLAYPVARYGLLAVEPFTYAFFRFIISSAVLMTVVKVRKTKGVPIEKKDIPRIIKLGILTVLFNQTAYLFGQRLTAAGHGSVLFATAPIWLFVGGILFFKEKFSLRRTVGIVLGLIGVAFIVTSGALRVGVQYLVGDLIIMGAVFNWVIYTILCRPLAAKYGVFRITAYTLTAGSIVYFPFGLYHALRFNYSGVPLGAWFSILYMALGLSVGYYVLTNWLMRHMETTRMAVFLNFQPVIAAVVAYIFLGEGFGWPFVLGWITVLGGIIITETG